jgi:hypothetical protein
MIRYFEHRATYDGTEHALLVKDGEVLCEWPAAIARDFAHYLNPWHDEGNPYALRIDAAKARPRSKDPTAYGQLLMRNYGPLGVQAAQLKAVPIRHRRWSQALDMLDWTDAWPLIDWNITLEYWRYSGEIVRPDSDGLFVLADAATDGYVKPGSTFAVRVLPGGNIEGRVTTELRELAKLEVGQPE